MVVFAMRLVESGRARALRELRVPSMNLKVQLNEAKAKLAQAETENRQLRAVIERAGLTLLEGDFVLPDGTHHPFYLEGL